ncbi:MAG: nickel pincer cofactor biosynthesis protein LarC, partial [Lachnospiraceae bacterium]|nr:nickel pincer cofactor biosynthesis protein LarC [Lachnospiraceae bacterium]
HTHDEHGHTHDEHGHEHAHSHEHRGLNEITQIIEDSDMTEIAKQTALKIFDILAQAESEAHGVPAEEVHFHEVGAIDSIVDIAAAAICLDDLGIREVIVPVLWEGCGTIRCQHGVLPIPVPATLNIVRDYQLNLHQTETMGEFVTPTGAAIVAAICTGQTLPERYRVKRTGLGGGKREYERPSILRAMLIMPEEAGAAEGIWKLECNIDDCSGEAVGYAMERLFASGARDVHYTPVYMKKNRPGYLITVLCSEEDREKMEEILFAETTTIGVRRQWMERTVLPRKDLVMMTSYGEVRIKELERNGKKEYSPEYESVAQVARENGIPFLTAYKKITTEICGDL